MITISEPRYNCTDCAFSTGKLADIPTCAICEERICPGCSNYGVLPSGYYERDYPGTVKWNNSVNDLMSLRLCMPGCWERIAADVLSLVEIRAAEYEDKEWVTPMPAS